MSTPTHYIRKYWARTVIAVLLTAVYLAAMVSLYLIKFQGSFESLENPARLAARFAFSLAHLSFAWMIVLLFRSVTFRKKASQTLGMFFRPRFAILTAMAVFTALHLIDFAIKRKYAIELFTADSVGVMPWEYGVETLIEVFSAPVGWFVMVGLVVISMIKESWITFPLLIMLDTVGRICVGYIFAGLIATAIEKARTFIRSRA